MNCQKSRFVFVLGTVFCLIALTSCAHEQQLISITIQPKTEIFGAPNIPVSALAPGVHDDRTYASIPDSPFPSN